MNKKRITAGLALSLIIIAIIFHRQFPATKFNLINLFNIGSDNYLQKNFSGIVLISQKSKEILPVDFYLANKEFVLMPSGKYLVEMKNINAEVVWKNYYESKVTATIADCKGKGCEPVFFEEIDMVVPAMRNAYSIDLYRIEDDGRSLLYSGIFVDDLLNWFTLLFLNISKLFT